MTCTSKDTHTNRETERKNVRKQRKEREIGQLISSAKVRRIVLGRGGRQQDGNTVCAKTSTSRQRWQRMSVPRDTLVEEHHSLHEHKHKRATHTQKKAKTKKRRKKQRENTVLITRNDRNHCRDKGRKKVSGKAGKANGNESLFGERDVKKSKTQKKSIQKAEKQKEKQSLGVTKVHKKTSSVH